MGDSFGHLFRITTWGESHGGGVGVVIDGCPAGLELSEEEVQRELDRRKPGQSSITTQRKESDRINILSGLFEGRTLGTALAMMVWNENAKPADYEELENTYRPSHADFTYDRKYGFRNWQGGGRSSARETVGRVAAGAVAGKLLYKFGIETVAWVSRIRDIEAQAGPEMITREAVDSNSVRCPDQEAGKRMIKLIEQTRKAGDSVGGVVSAVVRGCPTGLGEPVFDKLTADLAKGLMSIPATRGVEFGMGFAATEMQGSLHNDPFEMRDGRIRTVSNRSGGIQGGISNGEEITLRVAFKPTPTIALAQQTVQQDGTATTLRGRGRHDPCVLPRAVPVVEAMINLVLADHLLRNMTRKEPQALAEYLEGGLS